MEPSPMPDSGYVYVLTEEVDYEGERLLGVYTTPELATAAANEYWQTRFPPDRTNIWRITTDAAPVPQQSFDDETPVFSQRKSSKTTKGWI